MMSCWLYKHNINLEGRGNMPQFVSIEEAVKLIPDGASVMFGGFM